MFTVERMLNILEDSISKSSGHIWLILADTSFRITDFRTTKSALSWWCTSLQGCRLEQLSFASCQMLSVIQQRRTGASLWSKQKFWIPLFSFLEICFSIFPYPWSPSCYTSTVNKKVSRIACSSEEPARDLKTFWKTVKFPTSFPAAFFSWSTWSVLHYSAPQWQWPQLA